MIGRRGKSVLHAMGFAGAGLVPTYVAGQIISDATLTVSNGSQNIHR